MRAISDVILPYIEGHYVCIMASLKHFCGPFSTSLREKNRKFFKHFLTKSLAVNNATDFPRICTAKFTYSVFQHECASSPLSLATLNSWKKHPRLASEVSLPTEEENTSLFSSGYLDSLKDQIKTWQHHPCLTSSPYQRGITSDSSSVSKGTPHIKAGWKPQLWGKSTISFPS